MLRSRRAKVFMRKLPTRFHANPVDSEASNLAWTNIITNGSIQLNAKSLQAQISTSEEYKLLQPKWNTNWLIHQGLTIKKKSLLCFEWYSDVLWHVIPPLMNGEKQSIFQWRLFYIKTVLSFYIFIYHFLIIKMKRKIFLSSADLQNISMNLIKRNLA